MRSVVFYPQLAPGEQWLRYAVLTWDRVYLLSSRSAPPLPDVIRRLDEAVGGVLHPLPVDLLGQGPIDGFWAWLAMQDQKPVAGVSKGAMNSESQALFEMHADKFSDHLFQSLEGRGLARRAKPSAHGELSKSRTTDIAYVSADAAHYYLSACAGVAASERNSDLFAQQDDCAPLAVASRVGNDDRFAIDASNLTPDRSAILGGSLTTTLIEAHFPKTIATMPFARLAEIRRELSSERLAFQLNVQKLVDSAVHVSSDRDATELQHALAVLADKQIERTFNVYRRARLMAVSKSLGVATIAPGSLTWLASMLGAAVFSPAAIIAGAALMGAALVNDMTKAREDLASSGWSYFAEIRDRSTQNAWNQVRVAPRRQSKVFPK